MEVFKNNLLLCLVSILTIKVVVSRHVSSNTREEKEDPNNMKVPVRYSSFLCFVQPNRVNNKWNIFQNLSKSYIDLLQLGATHSNIWRRIWFLDKRVPTIRRPCNEEQETSSKKHWLERNRQQAYLNTRIHQWRSYSKNSFWNFSGIPEWSFLIGLVKMILC